MADIKFETKEIADFLVDYLDLGDFKDDLGKLRDIDWNPFNEDGDEYVGVWAEIRHNYDLVWEVAVDLCGIAEQLLIGGLSLTSEQKHKSVVEALDRALDCPWYLEPFDGTALGLLVNTVVKYLNLVEWGIGAGSVSGAIEIAPSK